MAKAPVLSDITNILNSTTILNANWDAIQAAFENTLSLDGSTPNAMLADLDLNGNDLLNVNTLNGADASGLSANLETVAGISGDITTVSGISADVTTVAGINADVTTVAADGADIGTVAGISADVTTVAGISSDVTSVAAQNIGWNFSTTTTMADPGSGNMRFNNATISSVTAVALDDLNSAGGNVSDYVITWDDSTSATKGSLVIRQGSNFVLFDVTGLTDNVGWTQLDVAFVSSTGSFTDTTLTLVSFIPKGDKGDAGAGSGDMLSTNNLSDVANVATSRSNLGVAIGSDVQAYDAQLDDISALAVTDGNIIVGNGTNWVAESGATARTSLGLSIGSDVQAWSSDLDNVSGTNTGDEAIATDTAAGIVELATTAEGTTGTATDKIPAVDVVKSMIDTHATGGWTPVSSSETTTDVSEVAFTGLSGQGYRSVKISWALTLGSAANLNVDVRVSAGTWRTIATSVATTTTNDTIVGHCYIDNWDDGVVTDFLIASGTSATQNATLDRSSNNAAATTASAAMGGYVSHAGAYDEIRVAASTGNIIGNTADWRGIVIVEAI